MSDRGANPLATKTAAVIGAGPAGLMAAEVLAGAGVAVTIYDRMPSVGRKLLMAGRGGLNLTHSEPQQAFLARYGAAEPRLAPAIEAFSAERLREWSAQLGQPTFVGTSGRVFPQAMKASPLLRAWLRRLDALGARFRLRHRWQGWRDGALLFGTPAGEALVRADVNVFALGGASWPHLGSDGTWVRQFAEAGVPIAPLKPANCGVLVDWSETFRARFEGQPLQSIALCFDGHRARGEAVVTATGLEGGGIYALSAPLRDAIARRHDATLLVALRPDLANSDLASRLAKPRGKQSLSNYLRKALNLSPVAVGLLQEAALATARPLASLTVAELAEFINRVPIRITGVAPIARAISSSGGVSFDAFDDAFMLTTKPGTFLCGEMLDWEAPTGGYLLQACFATGVAAGQGALQWLENASS